MNTLLVPEIDFCSEPKSYSTFDHGASIRKAMEKVNEAKVFERCYDFDDVSKKMWDKAKYVEVTIRPKDPELAPDIRPVSGLGRAVRAAWQRRDVHT